MLLERESELAQLAALLESGDAGVVHLQGEAGIGKTALLEWTAQTAAELGRRVLRARGLEREQDVPFGVARQLLGEPHDLPEDPQVPSARGILDFTAVPTLGSEGPEFLAFHMLTKACAELGSRQPLAIVVDDLHWADELSRRWLAYLVRRLRPGTAVALGSRPGEPGGESLDLSALLEEPIKVIRPARLSESATAALVELVAEKPVTSSAESASFEATRGVPLYVVSLALSLRETEQTTVTAEEVRAAGAPAIAEQTLRRTRAASPLGPDVARAVAVLGGAANAHRVAHLVGVPTQEVLNCLESLVRAGVLNGDVPLGFAHPLVAASVYEDIPAVVRAELHDVTARLLGVERASAPDVAAHLLLTEPRGDATRVAVLREAAAHASARGATALTVRLLRRALAEPAEADRLEVLTELGLAEAAVDAGAAVPTLLEAWRQGTPDVRRRILSPLVHALVLTGGSDQAVALVEEQLAVAGSDAAEQLRLDVLLAGAGSVTTATAGLLISRLPQFFALPGDNPTERLALALACLGAPTAAACVDVASRALGDGRLQEDVGADSTWLHRTISFLARADEVESARSHLARAVEAVRGSGSLLGEAICAWSAATLHLLGGELVAAEASAREAMYAALEGGWELGAAMSCACLGEALLGLGRAHQALEVLSRVRPSRAHDVGQVYVDFWKACCLVELGRFAEALPTLEGLAAGWNGPTVPAQVAVRPVLARALAGVGDSQRASEVARAGLEMATAWGGVRPRVEALLACASLSTTPEAVVLLRQAADLLRGSPFTLHRAETMVGLGSALVRDQQRDDGRAALLAGLELANKCHAVPLVERARRELAAIGRRPRRAAQTGSAALTPRERDVAELVALGLTNQQVAERLHITVKTVETHLSSAFRKVRVRDRAGLASALGDDPT